MSTKAAVTIEVKQYLNQSHRLNTHQWSILMDRNSANKKKHRPRTGETKILIGALAVTSALGFWNLFARQAVNDLASAGQSQDNTSTEAASPEASTNQVVLNLPPLPTLVPELQSTALDLQSIPTAPAVVNVAANTVVQQPTKILLGGSQPGTAAKTSAKRSAPAPVTSTRSSR
jgi:hypothetical protein